MDLDKPVRKELLESIKNEGVVLYEKFDNFKAALANLKDVFPYNEPYGNVEIAGMVGLYEDLF